MADIHGKSMIQHVWDKCINATSPDRVIVATDDDQILNHCKENKMQVLLTSDSCLTGTDRLYEIAQNRKVDVYINVQGDEPMVSPNDIKAVIQASENNPGTTINAMCQINNEPDFRNPNIPKVVTQKDGQLLYMSRSPIPTNKKLAFTKAMKQVCIYAFPYDVLINFGLLKEKTPLESIEDLEILRLLELGYKVKMIEVSGASIAVDTPQDLIKVKSAIPH